MKYVSALVRMFLATVALYAQYNLIIDSPRHWYMTFTAHANFLTAVVMLWAAWAILAERRSPPASLQGAVTLYMAITAVMYAVAIGYPNPLPPGVFLGMSNTVLHHGLTPAGTVLVWLLFVEHRRIQWKWVGYWLGYFYAYLALVVVRAQVEPEIGYIYSFIDANELGWGGFALRVALYTAVFGAAGALLIAIDRALPARTVLTESVPEQVDVDGPVSTNVTTGPGPARGASADASRDDAGVARGASPSGGATGTVGEAPAEAKAPPQTAFARVTPESDLARQAR